MCNYWHGGTIECRGDGYMWDADHDGYDPDDHSMPCPACNTKEYLQDKKEEAETTSAWSNNYGSGTGESIWLYSVRVAEDANPEAAAAVLCEIGIVEPILDDPNDPAGFIKRAYLYPKAEAVQSTGPSHSNREK